MGAPEISRRPLRLRTAHAARPHRDPQGPAHSDRLRDLRHELEGDDGGVAVAFGIAQRALDRPIRRLEIFLHGRGHFGRPGHGGKNTWPLWINSVFAISSPSWNWAGLSRILSTRSRIW